MKYIVYQFNFFYHKFIFSIDATNEETTPKIGRLVNHGRKNEINSKMKLVKSKETLILCLFAIKKILQGDEILYDYGIKKLPWELNLKKKSHMVNLKILKQHEVGSGKKNITKEKDLKVLQSRKKSEPYLGSNSKSNKKIGDISEYNVENYADKNNKVCSEENMTNDKDQIFEDEIL